MDRRELRPQPLVSDGRASQCQNDQGQIFRVRQINLQMYSANHPPAVMPDIASLILLLLKQRPRLFSSMVNPCPTHLASSSSTGLLVEASLIDGMFGCCARFALANNLK